LKINKGAIGQYQFSIEFGTTFSVPIQVQTSFEVTAITVTQTPLWTGTPPYDLQTSPSTSMKVSLTSPDSEGIPIGIYITSS